MKSGPTVSRQVPVVWADTTRRACRALALSLCALATVSVSGCDAFESRYLIAEVGIPELQAEQVSIAWYWGATMEGGFPVVRGKVDGAAIPGEKVDALVEAADTGQPGWLSDFLEANPEYQAPGIWERQVTLRTDDSGHGTVCLVRTRATSGWGKDKKIGMSMASPDGLVISGSRAEFICSVPPGEKEGVLWRRAIGAAGTWSSVGVVTHSASRRGGDKWAISIRK